MTVRGQVSYAPIARRREVDGMVAAGFEPVREAFAANFAERNELGRAVSAVVGGEVVVDLWVDRGSRRATHRGPPTG